MLRLVDPSLNRRQFLSVGSLALGGLTLPGLLKAREATPARPTTDKSVIFLFMQGGPSQTETFDPKMTAPSGVRSMTGEVATTIPGITFGGTFKKLARQAHRLAVVRNFVTGDGNHDIKPIVGKHSFGANLGSLYSRVAGTVHPSTGLPTNLALFPRSVETKSQEANMNFGKFTSSGQLGPAYMPFVPGGEGKLQQDMQLAISRDRLDDRRGLLSSLDSLRRSVDASGSLAGADRFQEQAIDIILRGAADSFDLSKEDPRVVARYDTAPLVPASRISKRWNNHKNYADNAATLGKLLLLARRLCERGAGFVTVTTNFVWDMHADVNNATMVEGMDYVGAPFDHAVSAFIEDCQSRGLSEKIMLVACGEMGRTPRVNSKGGRDHWGNLAPLLIYGGGLKMGQVIGESAKDAGEPAGSAVTIPDLNATVFNTLIDVGQARLNSGLPREVTSVLSAGQPIRELF
ncbi:MAG: DUF1501 domain-containing protein [Pedosphaera sp.]|nr:DUF1501 domain-containing protein [Pedosphaera sp.]